MDSTDPQHPPAPWWLSVSLGLVFLVGAATFIPTINYPFVYDDIPILVQHGATNGQEPWHRFWQSTYWPQPAAADPLYRPLTLLSLRLDHELWSGDVRGFRLTAMLLHGWISALAGLMTWRVFHRVAPAWFVGLVFAVHPVHGEVMGMVVGRSELLCALFVALQVCSHLSFVKGDWKPRWGHHLYLSVMFFLGLCSKEHGAFSFPVIMAIDWAYRGRMPQEAADARFRRLTASHYLGMFAALGVFLLLRAHVYGWLNADSVKEISHFANPLIDASLAERVWTPFGLLAISIILWFWPPFLTPVWSEGGFDLPTSILRWDVCVGVVLTILMLTGVVVGFRRRKVYGWILAAVLVLLIIPTHAMAAANWLFAERWLYVPSIFFALACAVPLARFPRAAVVLSVTLGLALFIKVWDYQRSWQNTMTIFSRTLERHPTSYQGLLGMAGALCQVGRFEEIDPYVDVAMELFPTSPKTWLFEAVRLGPDADPQQVLGAIDQFRKLTGWEEVPRELEELEAQVRARMASKEIGPS